MINKPKDLNHRGNSRTVDSTKLDSSIQHSHKRTNGSPVTSRRHRPADPFKVAISQLGSTISVRAIEEKIPTPKFDFFPLPDRVRLLFQGDRVGILYERQVLKFRVQTRLRRERTRGHYLPKGTFEKDKRNHFVACFSQKRRFKNRLEFTWRSRRSENEITALEICLNILTSNTLRNTP
jgi:hypothetical protein